MTACCAMAMAVCSVTRPEPAAAAVAPVLVLAWGNPSRGDDALGPLLLERLECEGVIDGVRVQALQDFQLQVEHCLDLVGRRRVLLVDASVGLDAPFTVQPVRPQAPAGLGSHALSPGALLHWFETLHGHAAPPCTQLALRAQRFELGEAPNAQALADLERGVAWVRGWVGRAEADHPTKPAR